MNKQYYIIVNVVLPIIVGLVIYFFQIHYIGAITSVIGDTLGGMFKEKNDLSLFLLDKTSILKKLNNEVTKRKKEIK